MPCPEVLAFLVDIGGICLDSSRMHCTPLCCIGKSERELSMDFDIDFGYIANIDQRWCGTLDLLQKSLDCTHIG